MSDQSKAKSKIFFPNLDGLRFVCFLTVFLYHCNETLFRKISDPTARKIIDFLFRNGNVGVNIFFVLSGFLITYLLIKEKELKKDISLTNFYMRRILRIWPLFYLCVFFGFVVYPFLKSHAELGPNEAVSNGWYYLFLAGNFDLIHIWPKVPDALPIIVLWSVAVEEQFYLSWPVLLKYISSKFYPLLFAGIIIFTMVFRSFYTADTDANYAILHFHTFSVIGDMALGGLMAYFCSYDSFIFRFIRNMKRWHLYLLYIITVATVLFKEQLFHGPSLVIERLVLAILFAFIIAEQNYAEHSFFKFSSFKTISKLGIYTYGLYCLHFIGILAVSMLIEKTKIPVNALWANLLACGAALLLTIIISLLSYHLFEKHFLKLKDRFAFIVKN
jgi:peptidoglycan/LPS O-acetylase OafA/YrhL